MFEVGNYYMHDKSADACVRVQEIMPNNNCKVVWHQLGNMGMPTPIMEEAEVIYMHPDVWRDVTALVTSANDWSN